NNKITEIGHWFGDEKSRHRTNALHSLTRIINLTTFLLTRRRKKRQAGWLISGHDDNDKCSWDKEDRDCLKTN
ncbi:hypothetical protein ACFQ2P_02710, partial [Levilactobacillus namurensis]|uniref:hypothetical protein n=1 Tax=Levilactobacillus namurensis TaxID=380393 RepID=UPI0036270038